MLWCGIAGPWLIDKRSVRALSIIELDWRRLRRRCSSNRRRLDVLKVYVECLALARREGEAHPRPRQEFQIRRVEPLARVFIRNRHDVVIAGWQGAHTEL